MGSGKEGEEGGVENGREGGKELTMGRRDGVMDGGEGRENGEELDMGQEDQLAIRHAYDIPFPCRAIQMSQLRRFCFTLMRAQWRTWIGGSSMYGKTQR